MHRVWFSVAKSDKAKTDNHITNPNTNGGRSKVNRPGGITNEHSGQPVTGDQQAEGQDSGTGKENITNPNTDGSNTTRGNSAGIDGEIAQYSKHKSTYNSEPSRGDSQTEGENTGTGKEKSHIDKLAYAVAMAETKNCELGYGEMYNNCFGIKNGSIAPCKAIGKNRMCIYDSPEESYAAFRAIWTKGYGGGFPTRRMAAIWTGNDRPDNWLRNVNHYYYN